MSLSTDAEAGPHHHQLLMQLICDGQEFIRKKIAAMSATSTRTNILSYVGKLFYEGQVKTFVIKYTWQIQMCSSRILAIYHRVLKSDKSDN